MEILKSSVKYDGPYLMAVYRTDAPSAAARHGLNTNKRHCVVDEQMCWICINEYGKGGTFNIRDQKQLGGCVLFPEICPV